MSTPKPNPPAAPAAVPAAAPPAAEGAAEGRPGFLRTFWGGVLIAAVITLVFQSLLALCLVQANHLLEPQNMPFGQTASSPVTAAVQSKLSLTVRTYPDQSAVIQAIDQGNIYGAYVPGTSSDTLMVVPAKSFFGYIILEGAFADAAHKLGRPLTVDNVKPLPTSDSIGGVPGLLLLPLLVGGLLAAVFAMKVSGRAAARWRVGLLLGYCVLGALLTDVIAGLGIGAFSSTLFWPLFGAFVLIEAAVALSTAALTRLLGPAGAAIAVVAFIVLGLASDGSAGLSMLPMFWQAIGAGLPPQNAVSLIVDIMYFGSNNVTLPLVVLGVYAFIGATVVAYFGWFREAPAFARVDRSNPAAIAAARRRAVVTVLGVVVLVGVMQVLFSTTYMASGHAPAANHLPFGVVGTSPLVAQVQNDGYSLDVQQYPTQDAATQAINEGNLYGMLVPGTAGAASTLYVVPTKSDIAPLDLSVHFDRAAKTLGLPLQIKQSAPTPLSSGDPYGIVLAIMLVPLIIGGYFVSTMLMGRTGTATARWRVAVLVGFAVVGALVVNLIVGFGLDGYPSEKFWVAWPASALIIAAVSMLASVLQKLVGPIGTLVTIIVVLLLGNPSSGGANGVAYLPSFWQDLGPFLPPRNGYLLLRNSVYFSGNSITQPLVVLLLYFVVFGVISSLLGNFRSPQTPVTPETEVEATAMTGAAAGSP